MRMLIRCVPAVAACFWLCHSVEGQGPTYAAPAVAQGDYHAYAGDCHGGCEPTCGAAPGDCGCVLGGATCVGFPRLFNFQSPCRRPKCGTDPCCSTIFGEMWCDVKGWGAKLRACTLCNSSVYGCSVTDAGFPGHGCKYVSPVMGGGCEPGCGVEYIEPSCDGCVGTCGGGCGGSCFQDLFRPSCGFNAGGILGKLFSGGCSSSFGCAESCGDYCGNGCDGCHSGAGGWSHGDGYEWEGGVYSEGTPLPGGAVSPTPAPDSSASRSAPRFTSGRSGRSLHYYSNGPSVPGARVANQPDRMGSSDRPVSPPTTGEPRR